MENEPFKILKLFEMMVQEANSAPPGGAPAVAPLHVANLDADVTDSQLYDLFSQVGDVVSVTLCRDPRSSHSLGYGFVNYANPQCAQRALEELNFTPLNGKPIEIVFSHRGPMTSKTDIGSIHIKNLDKETDHKDLHEIFSPFGNILSCNVAKDDFGQSMGYGFVQFAGEESAQKAIAELNGMILKGKQIYVESYLSKQERAADKAYLTNVFVKNFCESTTEDDLKNIFGEFGLIANAVVMRNEDGTSKCFGFVNFVNSKDAARAVESLNGHIFNEKKWYVGRAQNKSERQLKMKHHLECVKEAFDKRSNLYVKNLDDSIDVQKLKELFSPFGSVTSCQVKDKKGISTRGLVAYVAYSSPEEASRAISEMNGKILGSKALYVGLALRKEDRGAGVQNLDKEIDHKALHETFSSSCKVSTDASSQSACYGHAQFGDVESGQEAIGELKGIVRRLNGVIRELNGVIGGLNYILMDEKQVCAGPFLNKHEKKLLVYKANCTNVFVENLCQSTSEDDLKNIFGEFGPITSTVLMRNEDGTSKCFGFVNFENADDATRAVESLNGQNFDWKKWSCRRAQRRQHVKEVVDKGSNLNVNNLDYSTGNKKLTELFSQFGSVTSCEVMSDKKSIRIGSERQSTQHVKVAVDRGSNLYVNNLDRSIGEKELMELFSPFGSVTSCKVRQNKGIRIGSGFVAYSSPEEASRAISEMNGKILFSKPLYVALAKWKEDIRAQLQNLDKEIDRKALPESFSSSQDTLSCKVATDASGQSMGYDLEYTERAIEEHNGLPLNEKQVRAESLRSKQEKELPMEKANFSNVFVKNFCESTTEDKLRNIFCKFGVITSAVVMRNVDGTSKCFGFVSFEEAEDAARAVESLNGQTFDNKKWYVGRAQKDFVRKPELKHCPEQCLKDAVNKGSKLYVDNLNDSNSGRMLSEVFSPFRPVKSGKVIQGREGISGRSGIVSSPPVEASRAVSLSERNDKFFVSKPFFAAAAPGQMKDDRRARLQPGFGYQELRVPGMRSARPLMMNMFVPLLQRSCTVGWPTYVCPIENGRQPAPAMSHQTLPRGHAYNYPPEEGMYSVSGFPLHGAGISQPIPIGHLASSLANASQLGRGRCLAKFYTRLLNNWSLSKQLK